MTTLWPREHLELVILHDVHVKEICCQNGQPPRRLAVNLKMSYLFEAKKGRGNRSILKSKLRPLSKVPAD